MSTRFEWRTHEMPARTQRCTATLAAAFMFAISPAIALAQQTPPPPTVKEDMQMAAEKDVGYGAETSFLTWHGYLNLEGFRKEGTVSTFDLHEFYLSAKAQIAPKVSVTAEFEYEHTPEKLVLPIQAYADLAVNKAFIVRAGIFFAPIGVPRTYTLRGNKNRMIRQNALTHDLMFENWSDVGVELFGELPSGVFYDVAVTNGMPNTMATGDSWFDAVQTLQDHTEDNNSNKAVMSRFGYNTKRDDGSLNIGVSLATQKYDPAGTRRMTHAGIDGRYLHRSGFRFQGEYMRRSGDDNSADLSRGIAADADGWYAQVSKRMPFNNGKSYYEPVFQIDGIDLNRATTTNGDLITSAVGLVLAPVSHYLVKFEYDFVQEHHGAKLNNDKVWFALVAEF
jgi:hypothetical protein